MSATVTTTAAGTTTAVATAAAVAAAAVVTPSTTEPLDYTSHPAELVEGGKFGNISIKELRAAIPPHCFKPSYMTSFYYLARDLALAGSLAFVAHNFIPLIQNQWLRWSVWTAYGFTEGLFFTGLWVIGHECGHSAFSSSGIVNNSVGFLLHSMFLTPYFSWRSTHRRHHIYANNLTKDHNYVPPQREQYADSLLFDIGRLEELSDDSPLVTFLRIILQQLIGFPWYLLTNITAAPGSLPKAKSTLPLGNSHFAPAGALFRPEEVGVILASDLGLVAMAAVLWKLSESLGGWQQVLLLYGQPYLWLNHWIVAITYLHHTHPSLPKFEEEAWTFLKGATATVDRELWFVGRHLFHNIIEYHVIHHLFSRIPFYHAEEATKAVVPLLGDAYHADKNRAFLPGLWESFTRCQWVEPDNADAEPSQRAMWYKGGPSPPVETSMGQKGFMKQSKRA